MQEVARVCFEASGEQVRLVHLLLLAIDLLAVVLIMFRSDLVVSGGGGGGGWWGWDGGIYCRRVAVCLAMAGTVAI